MVAGNVAVQEDGPGEEAEPHEGQEERNTYKGRTQHRHPPHDEGREQMGREEAEARPSAHPLMPLLAVVEAEEEGPPEGRLEAKGEASPGLRANE